MSNNDLWCSKCRSQHHPAIECVEVPDFLVREVKKPKKRKNKRYRLP